MLPITTLFVDVGGVLLSDGWHHLARRRAAAAFKLDWAEMELRHRLTFEPYESGRFTLNQYLDLVVFHRKRNFRRAAFRRFMFEQSTPFPKMIELISTLRAEHRLKVIVVSNEARALNAYRVRKFKLAAFVDFFVSSSLVHMRKPDPDIFRLALAMGHVRPSEVVYIDNTPLFVEIAESLGIRSFVHTSYDLTRKTFDSVPWATSRKAVRAAP